MHHDVVVVGGGPGGYAVAFRGAARGLDVAVVERARVGGTCLHRGCIPSKAILHVAEVLGEIRRADELGLRVRYDGLIGENLEAFRSGVVDQLHRGLAGLVKQRATLYAGVGRVLERGVVEVTDEDGATTRLEGDHVVIATGSRPRTPPFAEVDGEVVMTSEEALRFTTAPTSAVIVGAGAIGMEFASMWEPMGTDVTVVEALERVLPLEDEDVSEAVASAFGRKGIEVLTGAPVQEVDLADGRGHVAVEVDGERRELEAEVVLVAVGRGPRTDGIGLEALDVLDGRGFVQTDELGRTEVEGLWAVGDVRPTLALAHAAFAEGFRVADAIAQVEQVVPVDYDQVPRVTYCHPEAASVGLTETEARRRHGDDAVVATTYSLRANAKGIIAGSDGFVKVVALADGPGTFPGARGAVLGVHVVGPHATDVIAEATLATEWGALPEELAAITHAHPTLYEAMGEAFQAVAGVAFHGH